MLIYQSMGDIIEGAVLKSYKNAWIVGNIEKNVSKIAHKNKRKCGNSVDKYI